MNEAKDKPPEPHSTNPPIQKQTTRTSNNPYTKEKRTHHTQKREEEKEKRISHYIRCSNEQVFILPLYSANTNHPPDEWRYSKAIEAKEVPSEHEGFAPVACSTQRLTHASKGQCLTAPSIESHSPITPAFTAIIALPANTPSPGAAPLITPPIARNPTNKPFSPRRLRPYTTRYVPLYDCVP